MEALATPKQDGGRIEIAGLAIDLDGRRVSVDGRATDLTAKEFDLLVQFARHPGHVYTRTQLLDRVWGCAHESYPHTVNSHINRLRAKIEQDPSRPRYVLTVWGVGYRFLDPRDASGR
jgi:DNA-binding response OmpR family regulator